MDFKVDYKLEGEYARTFAMLMTSYFEGITTGVGGSPRPSKCSLLINFDKTKVMASDGIACRVLIQNEQLEQVDTLPYLGHLITDD